MLISFIAGVLSVSPTSIVFVSDNLLHASNVAFNVYVPLAKPDHDVPSSSFRLYVTPSTPF